MRTYYEPLHLAPALRHHETDGSLAITEDLASRIISLPMANDLTSDELDLICSVVEDALA